MKRFRNILSLLLVVLIVVQCVPVTFATHTNILHASGTYDNENYSGRIGTVHHFASAPVYYGTEPEITYLTDAAAASAAIRDAMEARRSVFTVHYRMNEILPEQQAQLEERIDAIVLELWQDAFAESDKATQGDSLQYAWKSMSYGFDGTAYPSKNYTEGSFTFYLAYYTDATQEAALTDAVDQLILQFGFDDTTTDREKVDTIYAWLCDNVTYDYDNLEDESYTLKFTAYAAMLHRTAVCEGYALLFYRLAEECGLDARIITGKAGAKMEAHSWNIVKLEDKYYYLDSTWDAGKSDAEYDYYLKGESDFPSHYNDDKFNATDFRNSYPIAQLGLTAECQEYTLGNWKVEISGEQAVITAYLGNDKNVVVPASFDLSQYGLGTAVLPVDSVAMNVFYNNHTVESITISEGINRLAIGAINYCNNLKQLHLPSTLQMNSYGFSSFTEAPIDCYNLERVTLPENSEFLALIDNVLYTKDLQTLLYCPAKSGHTELTVPEGVQVIGNNAFYMHTTLEDIDLPSTLVEIDYLVFAGVWSLQSITLPENLRYIGQFAFSSCGITEITIPAKVELMLSGIFHDTKLQTITVDQNNSVYRMDNDMLIGDGILFKYELSATMENVTVPQDVIKVDHAAFESAAINSVILPEGLQDIGIAAFSDCKNLTHIDIPDNVNEIGDMAFSGCDMLMSITIPDSVTQLGKSLFHLGPPETYVTVFCNTDSSAEHYCIENNIAYKTSAFPCGAGHLIEKVTDEDLFTSLTDVWHFACSVCGCGTKHFTKSYYSISDSDITYKVTSTVHIYDGQRFTPEVLWVKKGETLLQEGVDYELIYGDNLTPAGVNHLYIKGIGDFRSSLYVPITIKKNPIQSAIVTLSAYEYEYENNPIQPIVLSVELNGKTLTPFTDYVTRQENNNSIGTGYVVVSGNGFYEGEVVVPFTIKEHVHSWSEWMPSGGTQHYRICSKNANCNEKQYADHTYSNDCDDICDVCNYMRSVDHSFTTRYASNTTSHWLICDHCGKADSLSYGHSGGKATCQSAAQCEVCKQIYGVVGEHEWELDYNNTQHWEDCKHCDATRRLSDHFGGSATCTQKARCETCGQPHGDFASHSWHSENNETHHWDGCLFCDATQNRQLHDGPDPVGCGVYPVCSTCNMAYGEPSGHSGGTATCTSQAYCQYCATPYGALALHQSIQKHNMHYHWIGCQNCDLMQNRQPHTGGSATCKSQAICDDCNAPYGAIASHLWSDEWIAVEGGHAHSCLNCQATSSKENHIGGTPTCQSKAVCTRCYTAYGTTLMHNYGTYVYNNDATTTKNGTKTRTCADCGKTQTVTAEGTMLKIAFSDVSVKEFYATPVSWAVSKGITTGTSPTTFSPSDDCTRGQIVAFLWRAAGQPKPKSTHNPFTDVSSGQYYYKAVLWAVENGITTGTSATTFSPDASCTRSQVVTFLWRAKGKPAMSAANPFGDVSRSAYYYNAVLWAVKNGITNGVSSSMFAPEQTCTRGQIVTFLYRAYN